jgi:phage/plasmid-associated DNA primase
VEAATADYRKENDTVGTFVETGAVLGDGLTVPSNALYVAYQTWAEAERAEAVTLPSFRNALLARGFSEPKRATSGPHKGLKLWHGIGLLEVTQAVPS